MATAFAQEDCENPPSGEITAIFATVG